jgi:dipeptidyl aminopeptidase/acylaminoacyl peptidase
MPRLLTAALLALVLAQPLAAQAPRPLPTAEYDRWETPLSPALSPDGRWFGYVVRRVDEAEELRLRPVERDTTIVVAWGAGVVFSADSRWAAWTANLPLEERRRLERERKPVRTGVAVRELATGAEQTFEQVQAFRFDASGRFLALHGYAPEEPRGRGGDLRVADLVAGTQLHLGPVTEFSWSDRGSRLAFVHATGSDQGNGVQLYDAVTGRLQPLDASGSLYRALVWRDTADDLAVLRSVGPASRPGDAHTVLAWRGVGGRAPQRHELDLAAAGVADTLRVVQHARPRWAEDGRSIAIGLRPAAPERDTTEAARSNDADSLSTVQLWHTSDVQLFPAQRTRAPADGRRTLLALWQLDAGRVVQLGSDLERSTQLLRGWRHAIEEDAAPYAWGTMFGRPYRDVHLVDAATGARTLALEGVRRMATSGAGRYLLSFDGTDWWTYDVRSGRRANITERLGGTFADLEYDTPTDQLPAHGVGGWLDDDRAVLLHDRYDVWRVAPDGSGGERLTRGAEERVVHRVHRLDTQRPTLDPRQPLWFTLHGERTQQRGFARMLPGRAVERLRLTDHTYTGLTRADSADVFFFGAASFDTPPDYWLAGPDLNARTLTRLNPFRGEYDLTRAELVDFTSEAGLELQASLFYPAGYDPSLRYPMIVYTYERMTPQIHSFPVPSERSYYNHLTWTQQGYFVLMPDIVYRARDPGISALEAVRPAVQAVVARGLVDSARVGLIGHSWGGYQATFLPTRTDLFAASVAGAPLTDFVSFMGQIHWNSGSAEVDHWETGQARMEVPFWEDMDAHFRNSPVHRVHEMQTPLLMAHGDEDGVVEFFQATQFYNFARRAGRHMVLIVYEGEDHGFRQRANQIDYTRRILEWFGHYLKGEPAPRWITDGIPFGELEAEKRRVAERDGG